MATQTFSQFVHLAAPLNFRRSRSTQHPRHGERIDVHQLVDQFFNQTAPFELRIEKGGRTFGTLRIETEYLARDTPAGLGLLHSLVYEVKANAGVKFTQLPSSAKLYFDNGFQLHGFQFGVSRGWEREHFQAVLSAPGRFHHTREMLTEQEPSTSTGNEVWRKWFALGAKASPRVLNTILRNIRPEISASFDETFGGSIISANLGLFPLPLRLFFDKSGSLIRMDQLPAYPERVINAPAS